MNNNLSPNKVTSFKPINTPISPFKKFAHQSPKNDFLKVLGSPSKYMNTQVNPQIGKNLTQSAHTFAYIRNNQTGSAELPNKQRFLDSLGKRDKLNIEPKQHSKDNIKKQQENAPRIRDRKFTVNDLTHSNHRRLIQAHIKQIQQQQQVVSIRDRKLSYQVNHFTPTFKKQNSSAAFHHPEMQRRQSDMLPTYARSKKQCQQNDRLCGSTYYSPKTMMDSGIKKQLPVIKQGKFRKNSENDNNTHGNCSKVVNIPSFLTKKSKKHIQVQQNDQSPKFQSRQPRQKKFSLKDFTVVKQLGQGKFGKVLLVKQKATNFHCAMKVFKKAQLQKDNFIDQFVREMKIQFYLNHPNVIKMYGYFDDLSYIYVLIQLACDGSLFKFLEDRQRQARHNQLTQTNNDSSWNKCSISTTESDSTSHKYHNISGLSTKEISTIMYQLCSGINYLHVNQIIHRDLKPQNIVIHEKTIKICDFGWSVFKGTSMRNTFCGTPLYLCPQLITGDQYDEKVDIWAIGIMLYEFIIGTNPFKIHKEEDLANIVYHKIQIQTQKNPIQLQARDLILGCLNKNPLQRLNIKQIMNHQYFKRNCPQRMATNTIAPRNSTSKSNV